MPDYLNPFVPSCNKRSYILKQTFNKKSKNCGKTVNKKIFNAFTYLFMDFISLWHKIT